MTDADGAAHAVQQAEAARCTAINAHDWAAVGAMLDEEYVHVHGNGRVTDKAATLQRLAASPRAISRGALTVRVWGDMALILGEQVNRDGEAATKAMVSQVLRFNDGEWRFVSLHFAPLRD